MGQGEILNSNNKGNWIDDNLLTGGNQDNQRFDIYSNAIGRYAGELQLFQAEDKTNDINDLNLDLPVLQLPEFNRTFDIINAKKYSKKIQSWEGIVLSVKDDTFIARLYDLTEGGTDEVGEFEMDDISPDDLELLSEGSLFYWSVGHYMENGQSVKRSDLRFQRLITLDFDDIEETKINIEKKYSNLKERKIDEC